MTTQDCAKDISGAIVAAVAARTPLAIHGSGSKCFLTGDIAGAALDVTKHRGIVSYEPTELVLTARTGTPLSEIESALAEKNQMLAFEPPHFGPKATLGGTIACNLSGPRRPYCGSARDFVLGTRIINGRGEILKFGGQVMKNVAGYDVSRLMAGSYGTLGVLLDISLKVLPIPAREITLRFEMGADDAIRTMNIWAGQPLPLSAACHVGDTLYVRLSGTDKSVRAAHIKLGGDHDARGAAFWHELREQQLLFFAGGRTPLAAFRAFGYATSGSTRRMPARLGRRATLAADLREYERCTACSGSRWWLCQTVPQCGATKAAAPVDHGRSSLGKRAAASL